MVLAKRALGTCSDCGAKGRIWSTRTSSEYPHSTEELCKNCSDTKKSKDSFEMAWGVVKEEEPAKCHLCNKGYLFSGDKQEPDEENFWVCSDCGTHFGEGY